MSDLDAFRADFKAVISHWRAIGEISSAEAERQYREAAQAVQKNMHDAEWMKGAAEHFARLAADVGADRARSRRISEEVRNSRRKAA